MLCLREAWFSYDEPVLRGASLCVRRGELGVLVGPMGSGKSTLLYALAGLLELEKGELTLDGKPFSEEDRKKVGILFQNPEDQLFNATVYDEIAYSLRTMGLDEEEERKRVLAVARELGIESLLNKNPFKLSYGQKKLVALASITVYEPEYLLLDEPTTNLDKNSYKIMMKVALERGALVATHELDWLLLSDVVYVMKNGEVVKLDPLEALNALEEMPVAVPPSWRLLLERDTPDELRAAAKLKEELRKEERCVDERPAQGAVEAGGRP